MLDDLNELRTLRAIVVAGSMSGAARRLNTSLAVVSKRIATLERRAGLRLLNRTTRSLSPTEEGAALLTHLDRVFEALDVAEEQLSTGTDEPNGILRVTAPVSFGRRRVVPVLAALIDRYPNLGVELSLNDRPVDVLGGSFDVAIRVGGLGESSATMLKLCANHRVLTASPAYLARHGTPRTPADLEAHQFLRYGDGVAPWVLYAPDKSQARVAAVPRMRADSGDALHDWCLSGQGIMMKSIEDVMSDIETGSLCRVLPAWAGEEMPIVALFASRHHQPRKLRVFLDAMQRALSHWRSVET